MMLDYLGWREAGALVERGLERAIEQKRVTYDFERQMQGATRVTTSGFADAVIGNLDPP
jgi:isocitrate dehydrogenase